MMDFTQSNNNFNSTDIKVKVLQAVQDTPQFAKKTIDFVFH